MTAARSAGAPSPAPLDWPQINWHAVYRNVRRLQARIVQATQVGRWGKVHALHHLLTHSCSGKALAVRRVTENHGNRTPGVDGETWSTPAQKTMAIDALRRRGYHPRPLRRVSMPKSNGTRRPLGLPTMHDRAMQALSLLALAPVAETTADPHSYGFRPARSPADALGQCSLILHKSHAPSWIFAGDIQACFDRISHAWLLTHVPMDKVILRKWLKAGDLERHTLHPTDSGTPQGGIISPVLANLALDGLERCLQTAFPKNGRGRHATINLVRYADDCHYDGQLRCPAGNGGPPPRRTIACTNAAWRSPQRRPRSPLSQTDATFSVTPCASITGICASPRPNSASSGSSRRSGDSCGTTRRLPQASSFACATRSCADGRCIIVTAGVGQPSTGSIARSSTHSATGPNADIATKARAGLLPAIFGRTRGASRCLQVRWRSTDAPCFTRLNVRCKRHGKIQKAAHPYDPAWELYLRKASQRHGPPTPRRATRDTHALAGTTWPLSSVPHPDYRGNGLAQPSYYLALVGGHRSTGEPRLITSELPSSGPLSAIDRNETASRTGR